MVIASMASKTRGGFNCCTGGGEPKRIDGAKFVPVKFSSGLPIPSGFNPIPQFRFGAQGAFYGRGVGHCRRRQVGQFLECLKFHAWEQKP